MNYPALFVAPAVVLTAAMLWLQNQSPIQALSQESIQEFLFPTDQMYRNLDDGFAQF
jgi:hypothetical protein